MHWEHYHHTFSWQVWGSNPVCWIISPIVLTTYMWLLAGAPHKHLTKKISNKLRCKNQLWSDVVLSACRVKSNFVFLLGSTQILFLGLKLYISDFSLDTISLRAFILDLFSHFDKINWNKYNKVKSIFFTNVPLHYWWNQFWLSWLTQYP